MMNAVRRVVLPVALATLAGCTAQVRNYGVNEHFSNSEASSGSTATASYCATIPDSVWVEGADFRECIRYYPSQGFVPKQTPRAIVFMAGDVAAGADKIFAGYANGTPGKSLEAARQEAARDAIPYLILARPGTDGSSGDQSRRRTRYETSVINAALDKIKARYGIQTYGLVGQSGGGGLVGALVAERRDVLCAVPSSGVLAVVFRAREKGRHTDVTGTAFSQVWDPIDQIARIHPMPGFRMFLTSSPDDSDVSFASQHEYAMAAQKAGLPVYQISVRGTGGSHHRTFGIGNRVVQACMSGLSTDDILKRFAGMRNVSGAENMPDDSRSMDELAAKIRQLAADRHASGKPAR